MTEENNEPEMYLCGVFYELKDDPNNKNNQLLVMGSFEGDSTPTEHVLVGRFMESKIKDADIKKGDIIQVSVRDWIGHYITNDLTDERCDILKVRREIPSIETLLQQINMSVDDITSNCILSSEQIELLENNLDKYNEQFQYNIKRHLYYLIEPIVNIVIRTEEEEQDDD